MGSIDNLAHEVMSSLVIYGRGMCREFCPNLKGKVICL
jgi:hypothetical protein